MDLKLKDFLIERDTMENSQKTNGQQTANGKFAPNNNRNSEIYGDFMAKQLKKETVLIALIETSSIRAAAQKADVSEATIYKYLQDKEFLAEYRNARRQTVETAIAQMQNAASEAVERLKELQHCENPAVAARCAQIIFENSIKGMETTDILERLEVLEKQ